MKPARWSRLTQFITNKGLVLSRDLLRIRGLAPLLKSTWFWRLVRVALLGLFVALIAYGRHHHGIPGVVAPDPLLYTNLATFGFWVLWMMGLVFVALLFGRLWCSFCPLGWLNGLVSRVGLRLPLPGALKNQYPVTLVLIVLQVVVYLLAIHRFPDYTAMLLSTTLGLVVLSGLLFRQRSFCRLFCPAGAVLALYARVAPFELRVRQASVCDSCESRRCVSGQSYWRRFSLGRGIFFWQSLRPECPVDLLPGQLSDASGCTLCLHCVQNCEHDNLKLGRRFWLAELGRTGLTPSETLFVLVLLGMVTANFSKVNVPLREILFWLPQQTALLLGWQSFGYAALAAIWICLPLPLALLLPGSLVLGLRGLSCSIQPAGKTPEDFQSDLPATVHRDSFLGSLGALALPFIPLILTAHLILALVKLNAKGGYLPLVFQDPGGVQSYLAMQVMHTISPPGALVALDGFKWIILALLLGGYVCSLVAARRVARVRFEGRAAGFYIAASALGLSISACLFLDTVIRWLFIR